MLGKIINNMTNPTYIITHVLSVSGVGLTYISKLLRFNDLGNYGVLNNRIRNLISKSKYKSFSEFPKIYGTHQRMIIRVYVKYFGALDLIRKNLGTDRINR